MGVAVAKPSYALTITAVLAPLRDPLGRTYPWTPCQETPAAYDEEAPLNVRRSAARVCRQFCPAVDACRARAIELARAGCQPRGVWAGRVMPRGEPEMKPGRRLPDLPPSPIQVIGDEHLPVRAAAAVGSH